MTKKYTAVKAKVNQEYYLIPQTEFHKLTAMLETRFQILTEMVDGLRSEFALVMGDYLEQVGANSSPVMESDGTIDSTTQPN